MALKNKGIKGCVICQNKKISDVVDTILFGAEMSHKDLKDKLQYQYGWAIELTEIKAHARHIFDDESPVNIADEIADIKSKKSIDLIDEQLAQVRASLRYYHGHGQDNTLEFSKMQKTMIELINLKAKIEGEISDNTIVVPEWVKRMENAED